MRKLLKMVTKKNKRKKAREVFDSEKGFSDF